MAATANDKMQSKTAVAWHVCRIVSVKCSSFTRTYAHNTSRTQRHAAHAHLSRHTRAHKQGEREVEAEREREREGERESSRACMCERFIRTVNSDLIQDCKFTVGNLAADITELFVQLACALRLEVDVLIRAEVPLCSCASIKSHR